jgi:hypothetical protein
LEKIKHKYFDNSKQAQDQEKSVLKSFTDKEKKRVTTDEDICNAHGNIIVILRYPAEIQVSS